MRRWKPPEIGYAKLNSEIACFNDGKGGLGAILQDHKSKVFMAATKCVSSLSNPLENETQAIICGLQLVGMTGFSNLEIEIDNLQVALKIKQSPPSLNALGLLVEDIFFIFQVLLVY